MEKTENLADYLITRRARDFSLAAANLPTKVRVMSKMFAKTLGASSGKMLRGYRLMLDNLEAGVDGDSTSRGVEKLVDRESKVEFKLPLSDPKRARICGLVALNYSGFFETETSLYQNLIRDLSAGTGSVSMESLAENVRQIGGAKPDVYMPILEQKAKNIYDFGVLMGINEDKERFNKLTDKMPDKLRSYFEKIARLHKGSKLGMSWPLPFKKFSSAIGSGLYLDSICSSLQNGIGKDCGFRNPEENRNKYAQMLEGIQGIRESFSSGDKSFIGRWQTAKALPAAFFYLSGLNVYADEACKNPHHNPDHVLAAATTAFTTAGCIANEPDDFITTWVTAFTCLV